MLLLSPDCPLASQRYHTSKSKYFSGMTSRCRGADTELNNNILSSVVADLYNFTSSRGSLGIAGFLNPAHFAADNRGYTQT